jgi:hypothetical protein
MQALQVVTPQLFSIMFVEQAYINPINPNQSPLRDRLCGLVVRVLGYRSGGLGSIPGTTRKKKVMGLEWGPLSLVSTTEELLDTKSSGSCLENREYGRRDPSRWPRCTLYPQKLAITSPTSGGRSVGIVHSRTQTMEFSFLDSTSNNSERYLQSSSPAYVITLTVLREQYKWAHYATFSSFRLVPTARI